jgi:hypothetical protein
MGRVGWKKPTGDAVSALVMGGASGSSGSGFRGPIFRNPEKIIKRLYPAAVLLV